MFYRKVSFLFHHYQMLEVSVLAPLLQSLRGPLLQPGSVQPEAYNSCLQSAMWKLT